MDDEQGFLKMDDIGINHMSALKQPKPTEAHQTQYGVDEADFFGYFNNETGRHELFSGYLSGILDKTKIRTRRESIAVDFGCGSGWVLPHFVNNGFDRAIGVDTSLEMLEEAKQLTSSETQVRNAISYYQEAPEDIQGKCNLVTAIHVHYHFNTFEKLKHEFFGEIAKLLDKNGEAIIIACPSDYIYNTPSHYTNYVQVGDLAPNILSLVKQQRELSNQEPLPICEDGYVRLKDIVEHAPHFHLMDGTQMKVKLSVKNENRPVQSIQLKDTFWSDDTLIDAAKAAGLDVVGRKDFWWRDHPTPAYVAFRFKKSTLDAYMGQ